MSMRRVRCFTAVLLFLFLTVPPIAAAAEESQDPADSLTGTVFRWLNFAIVVGALGYLVSKKMLPALRARAEAIRGAIAGSGKAQAEAEEQLHSIEAKLARLDEEVARLRAAAQQESEAEAGRIRRLAREEATKIEWAARAEIESAERSARIELQRLGAQFTVHRAEVIIREQINATTRATLFHSFLADLEQRTS